MKAQAVAVCAFLLALAIAPSGGAATWLEEGFDDYEPGRSLRGQGGWTGTTGRIAVVSSNSLMGNAVFCDADEPPILGPFKLQLQRLVTVPDSGNHVFSFAVRVDARTRPFIGTQASLSLGSSRTAAIELMILPETALMTIRNEFLRIPSPAAIWDLGSVPGGNPDLTTGTYHLFEVDLDFGLAQTTRDEFVRGVRVDGQPVRGLEGPIWLMEPMDRLTLLNGEAVDDTQPDAVFFDGIIGRRAPSDVRRWYLY